MPPLELFAVQPFVTADDYASEAAFSRKTEALFERIADRRERDAAGRPRHPGLAVFPEMYGTFTCLAGSPPAVLAAPTLDGALLQLALRRAPALLSSMARHALPPTRAFLVSSAALVHRVWAGTFARLAQKHRLTVVAGSALLPDGDYRAEALSPRGRRVYNLSLAFSPEGHLLDATRKVNLVPRLEDALGLSRGDPAELAPFVAPGIGAVGTVICYDGFREPHTSGEPGFCPAARRQVERGARILAQPSANPWPWDGPWVFAEPGERLLRREQWMAEGLFAQLPELEGLRFAVNPQLLGRLFDQHFDGRSYIFERIAGVDGQPASGRIVAQAAYASCAAGSEEVVVAQVEL